MKEIILKGLEFMNDVRNSSRTRKSAEVRLDVAKYLTRGNPNPDEIAARHGVTKRRVYQAIREMKAGLGLS
jgi:transposase